VPHLEAAARELREYQSQVIPGLIQTADYAKALVRSSAPWASQKDVERMVASRMDRQEILDKDHPPLVSMVVEVPVLTRPIGGPQVLSAQLDRTLGLIEEGKLRFQVMPPGTDTHGHPGASGPFRLYDFPDQQATVASAEHMEGEVLMDEPIKVRHCLSLFGILQADAQSPRESATLIRRVKDEIDGNARPAELAHQ
jgi:hypothetical protein